ncbi:MAG: bifunctional (p)ppGpp synthetase/guanosine-3',5'-bis(diphosphate) 3'-pyrophosphohydrolase [bacterium]|nr:bifunctional (p)ppGpp synthetase/guanosine-3',5'-bis(diphosphate) 3'-pyrophosphohydrolase [bacterium]
MDINKLTKLVASYNPPEDVELVKRAYNFAKSCHKDQKRLSGDPFILHPLSVAYILAELNLDPVTISASLLHDCIKDTSTDISKIKEVFSEELAFLVKGVSKVSKVARESKEKQKIENLRRMLLAMAEDVRVILIKLADRLHNMRTLHSLDQDSQLKISHETLEIYAPLAHRLGIGKIKCELEDLAFSYLQPEAYEDIKERVALRMEEREAEILEIKKHLDRRLRLAGIKAEILGRPKHLYSIYCKMQSHRVGFDEIYDLIGIRVIVDSVEDCYGTLGIIHSLWKPISGRFKDYISLPKQNMYQSLHTTVVGNKGRPVELQIRTHDMDKIAEFGVASHWHYKEGKKKELDFTERISWLRRTLEWQKDITTDEDFMESIKTDLFAERVFVFTPKGEIRDLPKNSTPIDFAYSIHTDIGDHCVGAKVNGRIVPLHHKLSSGDIVEIITSKTSHPSIDWLKLVTTSKAKTKIRQWIKRETEKQEEDKTKILEKKHPKKLIPKKKKIKTILGIQGISDMAFKFSKCCSPLPGDEIIGFVTLNRGISIHRKDCPNIRTNDPCKILPLSWDDDGKGIYETGISVLAYDRQELLQDLLASISSTKTIINEAHGKARKDGMAECRFSLMIEGKEKLHTVIKGLEKVRSVVKVCRIQPK